ncbi:hypothetical protein Tco_0007528, partial [Tanacetum coccineum]
LLPPSKHKSKLDGHLPVVQIMAQLDRFDLECHKV